MMQHQPSNRSRNSAEAGRNGRGEDVEMQNVTLHDISLEGPTPPLQSPNAGQTPPQFPEVTIAPHFYDSPRFDTAQPKCCCNRNQVCTYIVQYVMAVCFFVCGLSFMGAPMGYDPSLATWMALFFFSAGASRFYFARAKQLYINEPSPQIHGQFADKELNYFYVSNTALSGSAWFGLIFTQCCRLALCLVISNYSTVTAGFVITMIFVAIVFLMTPALSLGPKCFPPRTLRHSFTVKLFVVLCSVIMAGSLISSTELAGNKLGPKNIQQMQIAGVSQLLYAVVLMAGPKLLPLHICEALGLMLQLGLWQPVSVVMGNTPGTQF